MSKVILYIASSMDGYIARSDGDVSWLDAYQDVDYGYGEFFTEIGSLIMGSKTYEQVLSFGDWPYERKKVYVLTTRKLQKVGGVEFASGSMSRIVKDAKRSARQKDVWLVGGAKLASSFLRENLIEEIRWFVIPILLGEGIPLFTDTKGDRKLSFIDAYMYANGVVQLHYTSAERKIKPPRSRSATRRSRSKNI